MIEINAQSAAGTLSELKSKLNSITDLFDVHGRIFYVDYPIHNNIGDMLINIGTERFFLDHNVPIRKRYSVLDMPALARLKADRNTTFLCHGGGNFGDLYPLHQDAREWLIERFPHARIIFLPQSLYYSSEESQKMSFKKIAAHADYHILTRDRESLDALRNAGITKSSMMPDMAHQLWGVLDVVPPPAQGRDIYFLRRDREATAPPEGLAEAFSRRPVDWSDIVSVPHRARARAVYYLLKAAGGILPDRANTSLWYSARNAMVKDATDYFSIHDHVYTNRLHAMLLALLLGRDVTAFDNTYGKSSRYINAWLTPPAHHEIH